MRVLVIKTSSLGDVLHTLPALTDAARHVSGIRFDWVVEEAFAEVPSWHAAVDEVIPVAIRRWRGQLFQALRAGEPQAAVRRLRRRQYAQVIDAQGLLKSAAIARLARGPRAGLDRDSAREAVAARAYEHRFAIARQQHAVLRVRQLFAAALGYRMPEEAPDYGIRQRFTDRVRQPYLVFLHSTTWPTKHWPVSYWLRLATLATAAGLRVKIPWGTAIEQSRAQQIAAVSDAIEVLPRMSLGELAAVIAAAGVIVGVDTGLVHLAAALDTPCITLYGATDPGLIGTLGASQLQLRADFPCAPCQQKKCRYTGEAAVFPACYSTLDPDRVWTELDRMLMQTAGSN